jgi:predicted Zn-dependent protease
MSTKTKKIITVLSLTPLMFLFTNASNYKSTVQLNNKIDSTIGWIYTAKYNRRPTGNNASFKGNQLNFHYSRSRPINGADVSFGYFLYYTYDLYCIRKTGKTNCLPNLNVHYNIKGNTKYGHKVINISANGHSISTNYLIEAKGEFFKMLKKIGGGPEISPAEWGLIVKNPKASTPFNFKVLVPEGKTANNNSKFIQKEYQNKSLEAATKLLKGRTDFQVNQSLKIANQRDYDTLSQNSILRKYRGHGVARQITTVVTNQRAKDANGMAYISNSSTPFFVMKTYASYIGKQPTSQEYRTNALIILHELGHNMMGLRHCSPGQKTICTDNVWNSSAHTQQMIDRLKNIGALNYAFAY